MVTMTMKVAVLAAKIDDGAGNCVCPEGKVEDANGVCQADGDGDDDEGGCTGGKVDDGAGNCVCPEGKLKTLTVFAKMVTGDRLDGSGKEKDLAGNCVCPEGKVEDANGVCQAEILAQVVAQQAQVKRKI
jgi:hypothetical protein